jgi:hypothetical protein
MIIIMHMYNWYHSITTGIHYIHEHRFDVHGTFPLLYCLPLLLAFFCSLLPPFVPLLLTWNPSCCDRICPPRSQVARKLNFPFPSPGSYTPHSKIPTPPEFPKPKYTFIRTTLRTWLTRSSTVPPPKALMLS